MKIGPELELEDELVGELIGCGRKAHSLAQAHHNDPGSNGFTFGTDRYQRGTELAIKPLGAYGFAVARRGAGLIARRDGIEVQFAVARGADLYDPGSFDADSSPARQRAGAANAVQLALDGMPEPKVAPIVHVVWSGTKVDGLTAVHVGRLVIGAGERLDWAVLKRVDLLDRVGDTTTWTSEAVPSYVDQPVPKLRLPAETVAVQADES